jgi:glycosyltransferase involved in cell wall biosynthesis
MISVVICTLNPRQDYFERCLRAIATQRLKRDGYEVFVVDNGSSKPVAELDIVRELRFPVIREERPGLTAARECAARNAKHDLLVFVDDDNVLSSDYLINAASIFADPKIGYLSGEILPEYELAPPKWFSRFEKLLAIRRFPANRLYVTTVPEFNLYFPVGAGCCIRRSLLLEYFDSLQEEGRIEGRSGEHLTSGEDQDIGMFVLSRGYYVGSSSTLKLCHLIPRSRLRIDYLKKLARAGIDSAHLVNRKWRKVFGADVIPTFATENDLLAAKAIICTALSLFSSRYAIPAVVYRRVLALRRAEARDSRDAGNGHS